MNKPVIIAVALSVCFLLIGGCDKTELEVVEEQVIDKMEWLYDADPYADFEAAVEKKDYRFIGLYGVKLYIPRVNFDCLDYKKDINPIEGTSDATMNYEHRKLIAIAQAYASDYNTHMLIYLEEQSNNKGFSKCAS